MSRTLQEVILTVLNRKDISKNMYDKFPGERIRGQDMGLYLAYSTYLAEDKKVRESLEMLCSAIKEYSNILTVDKILPVVSQMVETLRQETKDKGDYFLKRDPLSCPRCCGILFQPLTLPCGHTYCKCCILSDLSACLVCQAEIPSQEDGFTFHTNILVSSIVQNLWPQDVEGATLRNKANKFFKERQFTKALELYSEAVSLAPNDHLLLSNRAHTFHALVRGEDALRDANEAVLRRPEWAKGHFRQARALASLGREEEAFVALLVCACLECSRDLSKVVRELARTLLLTVGRRTMKAPMERILKPACNGMGILEESRRGASKENLEGERRCAMRKRRLSESGGGGAQDPLSNEGTAFAGRVMQKFVADIEQIRSRTAVRVRHVDPRNVHIADFECALCYHCLWEPVTTPCGHTFCRSCLDRSLDHAIHCPLCKTSLREYLAENRSSRTEFLEEALRLYLPTEHDERGRQHELEMCEFAKAGKDPQHEIPIFVATLAIPSVSCPLHVFEPRYRLMVRRVMEAGTREFGMCMPCDADEKGYSNYGTMLKVREVRPLNDGRRIVNAVGSRRFRCVSKGVKDGYNTASVEYLQDDAVGDCTGLEELRQLHDSVHLRARSWFESINVGTKRRILGHYGPMPAVESEYWTLADGPVWIWWLIAILPLEHSIQMRLMRECSLHARLGLVSQILRCVLLHQSGARAAGKAVKAAPAQDKRAPTDP